MMKSRSRKLNAKPSILGLMVLCGTMFPGAGIAGEADVLNAKAVPVEGTLWQIEATVSHADEGWDHYANAFEVLDPDGKILGVRELLHPHVTEQPFTRSLGRVSIPPGTDFIVVRARDSVHEYGGKEFRIDLPDN
jgi:hypothetical protein